MARISTWRMRGEVRVEFGLLFGLVAVLSFFATPFLTGGNASTDPQEGLASLRGQPRLQLGRVGNLPREQGGKGGGPLHTSDALSDTATAMGTNATSTDGIQMGRAAAATAANAGELDKLARQLENAAGGESALADMLANLAGQGGNMASAQQSIAKSCRGNGQCAQLPKMRQAQAAFQAELESLITYLANHPEALTPEMEREITRHASEILSHSEVFQNASGQMVLNTKDMGRLQEAYNRCINRDDAEACIEQTLQ
ncbi:MAG TPA: hypothetical protein V6C52_15225 [Coleofasciculaceae cyanobacterium]